MGVHRLVPALPDQRGAPQKGGDLGVAAHAEVAYAGAAGADHLGHRAGVVERDDVGLVAGVRQDLA
jgi:hypothetical protein